MRHSLAELLTRLQASDLLLARAVWLGAVEDFEAGTLSNVATAFVSDELQVVAATVARLAARAPGGRSGFFTRLPGEAAALAHGGTSADRARVAIADDLLARYEV